MTAENFPDKARALVLSHVKSRQEPRDRHVTISLADVYLVSFAFVRDNWKAMISTTLPDGMYYEVTHSEQMKETYICSYKQWENVTVPDSKH
jgi:uncharacterized protein DUF6275